MTLTDENNQEKATLLAEDASNAKMLIDLYVKIAAHPDHPDQRQWNAATGALVGKLFEEKKGAVIDVVVDALLAQTSEEPLQVLNDDLEDVASHRPPVYSTAETRRVSTFAIPVIVLSDISMTKVEQKLALDGAFTSFEASIAQHGLPEVPAIVKLIPYLYTPTEMLEFSPEKVWHLAPKLANLGQLGLVLTPADLNQAIVSDLSGVDVTGDAHIAVRYLVGTTVSEGEGVYFEDASSFELDVPDSEYDARQDAYMEKMQNWCIAATPMLSSILSGIGAGEIHTIVQPPAPIFLAYRAGLSNLSDYFVSNGAEACLEEKALFAQETYAVIAPYGDDAAVPELRISLLKTDNDSFVYGLIRDIHTHEDPAVVASEVAVMLKNLGVSHIEYPDSVQILDYLEDEPVFLAPNCPGGVTTVNAGEKPRAKQGVPKILH